MAMSTQQNQKEITLYLTQVLTGYEVIPANFGWHIHKGNVYCGELQYQGTKGWQGSALSRLAIELQQQLKEFAQSGYSMSYATTYSALPISKSTNAA